MYALSLFNHVFHGAYFLSASFCPLSLAMHVPTPQMDPHVVLSLASPFLPSSSLAPP